MTWNGQVQCKDKDNWLNRMYSTDGSRKQRKKWEKQEAVLAVKDNTSSGSKWCACVIVYAIIIINTDMNMLPERFKQSKRYVCVC